MVKTIIVAYLVIALLFALGTTITISFMKNHLQNSPLENTFRYKVWLSFKALIWPFVLTRIMFERSWAKKRKDHWMGEIKKRMEKK